MPPSAVKETAEYRVSNEKLKKTAEQDSKHLAQSSLGEGGADLSFLYRNIVTFIRTRARHEYIHMFV